jgi:hypothetical protein
MMIRLQFRLHDYALEVIVYNLTRESARVVKGYGNRAGKG